jgi:NAD(P)-dependent dehydrogenase (short-subunit alcohol dehydrogenase family)
MSVSADRLLLLEPPSLRLDGRVVWLTGASRGLGRALAYALAGAGAELVLSARSESALTELADEIRAHGGTVETVVGSVTDADVIGRTASLIEQRWGRLDALVNNAGISPAFVAANELDEADWRTVLDVNLSAPLACCKAAFPLFERAGSGSVVNISSIHGSRAHQRMIAYAASKGGLEMVTRTLAVEWAARAIRVNAVAPGYLETDMTAGLREHPRWSESLRSRIPMGRFAAAGEVAPAVLLLAGPGSSYITGTTLYVDGGWTAT